VLQMAQLFATMCTGLFAGAALYINLAEHPAHMSRETRLARPVRALTPEPRLVTRWFLWRPPYGGGLQRAVGRPDPLFFSRLQHRRLPYRYRPTATATQALGLNRASVRCLAWKRSQAPRKTPPRLGGD
jgi:hypothetical protein